MNMKMKTFIDDFISQADKNPSRVAAMDCQGADTYLNINRKSALLAEKILTLTEGRNARVALLMPRCRDYVTSLIAVIRAGCCAVPLDSEYPPERVKNILKDSGCTLCVTTGALAEKSGEFSK
ncbi:MAG: AMP-binding protein, partial [Synergistaceae bacterium]|nr:AMP-binding protein [Synergistaceae bacterium]